MHSVMTTSRQQSGLMPSMWVSMTTPEMRTVSQPARHTAISVALLTVMP